MQCDTLVHSLASPLVSLYFLNKLGQPLLVLGHQVARSGLRSYTLQPVLFRAPSESIAVNVESDPLSPRPPTSDR